LYFVFCLFCSEKSCFFPDFYRRVFAFDCGDCVSRDFGAVHHHAARAAGRCVSSCNLICAIFLLFSKSNLCCCFLIVLSSTSDLCCCFLLVFKIFFVFLFSHLLSLQHHRAVEPRCGRSQHFQQVLLVSSFQRFSGIDCRERNSPHFAAALRKPQQPHQPPRQGLAGTSNVTSFFFFCFFVPFFFFFFFRYFTNLIMTMSSNLCFILLLSSFFNQMFFSSFFLFLFFFVFIFFQ
jgi:hypothetical protein